MMNVKAKKFILNISICTFFTLLYVHQNIEILKLGYLIDSNQKVLSYSLDQHKRLVYNLSKLESPLTLDKRLLAEKIKLVQPDRDNVYYASARFINKTSYKIMNNNKMRIIDKIFDAFTGKAEASSK